MGAIFDGVFQWLGMDAQADAADKAARVSQDATDKTLGFLRETRDQTRQDNALQRYYGNQALGSLGSLFGYAPPPASAPAPTTPAPGAPPQQPAQTLPQINPMLLQNPAIRAAYERMQQEQVSYTPPPAQPAPAQTQQPAPQPAQNAFGGNPTAWLRNTPGYQFNFDEGMRALNTGLARSGQLQSGAAAKSAIEYGQNYGDRIWNQERNALFNLAGYGQVANQNNQQAGQAFAQGAGNALQNNAMALGQSSYAKGDAKAGMWGGINGSLNSYGNAFARMMGGF